MDNNNIEKIMPLHMHLLLYLIKISEILDYKSDTALARISKGRGVLTGLHKEFLVVLKVVMCMPNFTCQKVSRANTMPFL